MTLFRSLVKSVAPCLATASAVALVLAALASQALAGGAPPPGGGVPEVDPGSLSSALTLLAGGVLVLRARIRR
jgi:hypothetical protein